MLVWGLFLRSEKNVFDDIPELSLSRQPDERLNECLCVFFLLFIYLI